MSLKLIICLIFIYFIICINSSDSTEVKTSSGVVRGKSITVLNKNINQFLGIPFAEAPIGKLRFSKPKPLEKSIEGVLDATIPGHSCMQLPTGLLKGMLPNISEDCLVLNIWSPQTPQNAQTLKPVMFYIHGGKFMVGSAFQIPPYNGSILATYDVVIVVTNYRVGTFGFLYGGTDDAPGNLGFYDQLLAIKWVRENIHLFGGDKNQITIFGESAGSWSVSAQVLSPLSKGLFHRAIIGSGADFHGKSKGFMTTSDALKQSKDMAKHFNCNDDQKWLDCLRAIDADSINNYADITTNPLDGTDFLPIFAQEAFEKKLYNTDIDIIAGVVRDEGSVLLLPVKKLWGDITLDDFKALTLYANSVLHNINVKKVLEFYLKNVDTENSDQLRKAFIDFFGDIYIKCPTYLFAKKFSQNSPHKRTYFYQLTHNGKFSERFGCVEKTMGICHASDVEFIFGVPIFHKDLNYNSPKHDIDFSLDVMEMWTNFAKTGDPGHNWPQLIAQDNSVVKILNPHESNSVLVDPFKSTCDEFWKDYFEDDFDSAFSQDVNDSEREEL